MAKRKNTKRKTKSAASDTQRPAMVGGLLILVAVLSFLSIFSDKMGIFGDFASKGIGLFFGKTGPIFCGLLLLTGLFLILDTDRKKIVQVFLPAITALAIAMLHFYDPYSRALDWEARIDSLQAAPIDGGLIGQGFSRLLTGLFGTMGSRILLILLLFVSLYLLISDRQKMIWKRKILSAVESVEKRLKARKTAVPRKRPSRETAQKKKIEEDSLPAFDFEAEAHEEAEPLTIRDYMPDAKPERVDSLDEAEKEAFRKDVRTEVAENVYAFPPLNLLKETERENAAGDESVRKNAAVIQEVMYNFNVDCRVTAINKGPTITSYELEPSPGVKISRIVSLHDNLSLSLASPDIRIEAPIPGKSAIGIEVPNAVKDSVGLREILESDAFQKLPSSVPLTLGKDVSGHTILSTIDKMPHLLIAGATGSGKSVCINSILMGILYKSPPEKVRLILIDPKVVELGIYNGIPHLLIPVVTDAKKAAFALAWAVEEMEKRYKAFADAGVRDISGYNRKMDAEGEQEMAKIVIVVDELSDLMMVAAKEVEDYITRLAQMARAAGIHLILATQRPSVDVITGTIKANIPSRIAFSVSSQIDSRTILDMSGAEKLLGKGDMLFYPGSYPKPKRLQGAFVSDGEVERVLEFVKNHTETAEYDEEAMDTMEKKVKKSVSDEDPLLGEAVDIVLTQEQASISFLQRKLKVGYARAARIVDQIEEMGIIGPHEGPKPRKLLMTKEEIESMRNEQENL